MAAILTLAVNLVEILCLPIVVDGFIDAAILNFLEGDELEVVIVETLITNNLLQEGDKLDCVSICRGETS